VTAGALAYTIGAVVTFVVATAVAYVKAPPVQGGDSIANRLAFATLVGLCNGLLWFFVVPLLALWCLVMAVVMLVKLIRGGWRL
jgi:hypothetical protein